MPYPEGVDWVWVGVDSKGHVAAFVTAGIGPAPGHILGEHRPSIDPEGTEERISDLPRVSEAIVPPSQERHSSFVELAERGFFVFDWTDVHRTLVESKGNYEKVAEPASPLALAQLPADLRLAASSVQFDDVTFSAVSSIDVRRHFRCAEPSCSTG